MKAGDEKVQELMASTGKSLLELFPMEGDSTECPRCSLEFKTMLHPFCQHHYCPPRDYTAHHPTPGSAAP